ncbi:MAG: methyltransferase family protein [Gammaproteobacteria bacterium]
MIKIGNFFFKYRNWLFVPLYLTLFLPSPELLAPKYHAVLLFAGLFSAMTGEAIRGATIGLAYIRRGGRNKQIYAPHLVTEGIFNHCRNPLYIGNILMLLGIGILSNSLLFIGLIIPVFLLIYQAMVIAEENFLREKFGAEFDAYCRRVNRWLPVFSGLKETFNSMEFKWHRWLVKELSTQYILLLGITFLLLFKYPELTGYDPGRRNLVLVAALSLVTAAYLTVRRLKKTGKIRG